MNNILLLLSFMLNFITILCIVLLYLRQNKSLHMERDHERLLHEMEEVISTYLIEMKEENDKFIQLLDEKAKSNNLQMIKEMAEIEPLPTTVENEKRQVPKKNSEIREEKNEPPVYLHQGKRYHAVQAYKNTSEINNGMNSTVGVVSNNEQEIMQSKDDTEPIAQKKDEIKRDELPIYEQAFLLENDGLSIEDIAKKLHKGKTEIELLLTLGKKSKE